MDPEQARATPGPHGGRAPMRDPRDAPEREPDADEREADRGSHRVPDVADESARDARRRQQRDIVENAEARDEQAGARDSSAERRDRDASLSGFLGHDSFGDSLRSRRWAALDRLQSKDDRMSAAFDRSEMADLEPPEGDSPSAQP